MTKIIDPNSKRYVDVENLEVVTYEMPDENGDPEGVKCVEYTVIGNNRKWRTWCPYEKFAIINDDVEI